MNLTPLVTGIETRVLDLFFVFLVSLLGFRERGKSVSMFEDRPLRCEIDISRYPLGLAHRHVIAGGKYHMTKVNFHVTNLRAFFDNRTDVSCLSFSHFVHRLSQHGWKVIKQLILHPHSCVRHRPCLLKF